MYRNAKGEVFFSDTPAHQGFQQYRKPTKNQPPTVDETITRAINRYAKKYQIDPMLVRSVIKAESAFDPKAVSSAGAQGLMQLMPATAASLRVDDPFDPEQNIRAGVAYLRSLLNLFGGDLRKALAAYNAGPTQVVKRRGVPPFPETIHYIQKVLRYYQRLKKTF